jgi:hypothetical protein
MTVQEWNIRCENNFPVEHNGNLGVETLARVFRSGIVAAVEGELAQPWGQGQGPGLGLAANN